MITIRFKETTALRLAFCTLILQVGAYSASGQTLAGSTEPSEPKPSAAVEKILSEASHFAEAKQPADSLKMANQALDAARQANDKPGEAFAQQARGKALQDLQRKDEALAAWQDAARLWTENGDTPEQITALVSAGLVCVSEKKSEAEKFFAEGLSIGKVQTQRPAALAQVLQDAGAALGKQDQKSEALNYLGAALALREKQTPESLQLVEVLDALGNVALQLATDGNDEKYYSMSKDYFSRAVEVGRRVAPDSPVLVRLSCGFIHAL